MPATSDPTARPHHKLHQIHQDLHPPPAALQPFLRPDRRRPSPLLPILTTGPDPPPEMSSNRPDRRDGDAVRLVHQRGAFIGCDFQGEETSLGSCRDAGSERGRRRKRRHEVRKWWSICLLCRARIPTHLPSERQRGLHCPTPLARRRIRRLAGPFRIAFRPCGCRRSTYVACRSSFGHG